MITDPTDWVVAIPSYQRANLIGGRALQTLQAGRVARERIYIFVADEAERAAYECALPRESYGKIVTGVKGLTAQRNFITDISPTALSLFKATTTSTRSTRRPKRT